MSSIAVSEALEVPQLERSIALQVERSPRAGIILGKGVVLGKDFQISAPSVLSLGFPELERVLPLQGLPEGQIVELAATSSSSCSTTLGLWACREAQARAALQGGEAWCAFLDPRETLYAPGALQAGVNLERLLVLRPSFEAVSRIAVKLAEARAFSVLIIDLCGVQETSRRNSEDSKQWNSKSWNSKQWVRAIRRMALAIENTKTVVLLLTDAAEPLATQSSEGPFPSGSARTLPVGMRIHLSRQDVDALSVSVTKEKQGRLVAAQRVQLPWRSGIFGARKLRRTSLNSAAASPTASISTAASAVASSAVTKAGPLREARAQLPLFAVPSSSSESKH